MLAGAGLGEEGVEGVVAATDGLVRRHLAVRLDAVLEAVELPAGVTRLDAALAHVDGDDLTLWVGEVGGGQRRGVVRKLGEEGGPARMGPMERCAIERGSSPDTSARSSALMFKEVMKP